MIRTLASLSLSLMMAALVAGCDGSGESTGAGGSGGSGGSDQGGGGTGGMGSGGMAAGGTGGAGGAVTDPPTDESALFQWLKDGKYLEYAAETAPHPSNGPHGGSVRAFINPILADSFAAGNSVHPKGAAAVKELYQGGSTVSGWAVEIKTQDDSAGGQGWYWYEIYSATDPSNPVVAGNGKSLCYNCHSGGTDYVLTPYPLQ